MTVTPPSAPPPAGSTAEASDPRERWLFLLSGGLLLVALLVAIGRERHWGEPQFGLRVVAPRADGLQEGMEVRLSGMPIGRLEALRLRNDARVEATLRINARYRHLIGPRSRAQSGQVGLVGQSYVSLTPDPQPQGTGNGGQLPALTYEPPPDLNQLVAALANSNQQLDRTLAQASSLLQSQVPSSLGSLRSSMGQLSGSMGKLSGSMGDLSMMSKTVAGETRSTVPSVRALTANLNREAAQLGPAARRTLAKADQTLTKADQTAATAERTARDAQELLRQANPALIPTLRNLREITDAGAQLVRFFSGLGLLEPSTPRSPSPQKKPANSRTDAMDAYKAHPTAPDPSP